MDGGHSTETLVGITTACSIVSGIVGGMLKQVGEYLIEKIRRYNTDPPTVKEKIKSDGIERAMEFLEDQLNSTKRSHAREVKELVEKLDAAMDAHHDCEVKHERMLANQEHMQAEIKELREKLQRSKQVRTMPDLQALRDRREREQREREQGPHDVPDDSL